MIYEKGRGEVKDMLYFITIKRDTLEDHNANYSRETNMYMKKGQWKEREQQAKCSLLEINDNLV